MAVNTGDATFQDGTVTFDQIVCSEITCTGSGAIFSSGLQVENNQASFGQGFIVNDGAVTISASCTVNGVINFNDTVNINSSCIFNTSAHFNGGVTMGAGLIVTAGNVEIALPSSDPGTPGQLYQTGGVVMVSL